jgi:hypothetical protein
MLRSLLLFAVLAGFAAAAPSAPAAVDPDDWASAVTALHEVDPTVSPPLAEPGSVSVVGGGTPVATAAAFGISVRQAGLDVSGTMVLVLGSGNTLTARPVCVGALPLLGGGGIARMVGELDEPFLGVSPTLIFDVTDSGVPGGVGDAFNSQMQQVPPSEADCTPVGSVSPLEHGSIVIDFGD